MSKHVSLVWGSNTIYPCTITSEDQLNDPAENPLARVQPLAFALALSNPDI